MNMPGATVTSNRHALSAQSNGAASTATVTLAVSPGQSNRHEQPSQPSRRATVTTHPFKGGGERMGLTDGVGYHPLTLEPT